MNSYFSHQTVVVTGAAGFIGSHLCEVLLHSDAVVIGVDNFITGQHQNIDFLRSLNKNFTFIEANVSEPAESYLPAGLKPDCILHFASPASPPRYQAHPIETYLVNSLGTHHLLQYLHHHNPQGTFLFAGTSEAYGDPTVHPQPETYWGNVNPNGPRSCYDEAKRLGESICGVHHRDLGMNARIVRIFNTYGPRMDLDDGRVVPNFIKEALNNQPLSIYGDGSQTRSYCFVSNLVEGILRFATLPNLAGETINLGNPEEYSILETANIIKKVVSTELHTPDKTLQTSFHPLPTDDPTRRRPDITKAQTLLGWSPSVSFTDGLARTIRYFHAQTT